MPIFTRLDADGSGILNLWAIRKMLLLVRAKVTSSDALATPAALSDWGNRLHGHPASLSRALRDHISL